MNTALFLVLLAAVIGAIIYFAPKLIKDKPCKLNQNEPK